MLLTSLDFAIFSLTSLKLDVKLSYPSIDGKTISSTGLKNLNSYLYKKIKECKCHNKPKLNG